MATRRTRSHDDDEDETTPETTSQIVEVSEARQKFNRGEITWRQYLEAENQ